jgi:hypothetical protein
MIHTRSLIDILNDVVSGLSLEVNILSVIDNGNDTFSVAVDDLKWAEVGRIVQINSFDFTIQSIDDLTNTIVFYGTDTIFSNTISFDLYAPYFWYGTPIAMNNQIQEIKQSKDKTPMIYLMLKFSEKFNTDNELMLERESTVSLYFLTQADFDAWGTDDFYTNAIRPMRRLMDLFIDSISSNYQFDTTALSYTATDLPMFGVYVNTKGATNSWFSDNLSGVQLDTVLKINRTADCFETPRIRTGIGFDEIPLTNTIH